MLDTERVAKLEAQVESIKEDVSEVKADIKEVHSRITTGNREIVGMLQEVEKRMSENAAMSARQHQDIKNAYSDEIQKVSRRVTVLEQWKWYVIGIACASGYLIGHIDVLTKFLK
jgi:archaellum component FlaC